MAYVYGDIINGCWRAYLEYSVTTNNNTTYAVTCTVGLYNVSSYTSYNASASLSSSGLTSYTGSSANIGTSAGTYHPLIENKVYSWSKSKTSQSKTVNFTFKCVGGTVAPGTSSGLLPVTIPAKTSYAVKYNANSGSGAPSAQTKWYGESLTLSSTKPTRTGYTFVKWNTAQNGSGTDYSPGGTYTANSAVTLYAQWQIITYTIKYNSNGGSGTIANQSKNYGASVTLSSGSGFSRMNYELTGWNTKSGGTGTSYAKSGTYSANASVTLYAQWELAYTKPKISDVIVYKCNSGGTADDEGTYIHVSFSYTGGKQGDGTYIVPKCGITVTTGGTTTTARAASTSGMSTSGTFSATYGSAYSADVSHTVTIILSDSYGSVSSTKTVPTALYPLDFLGKADGSDLYMGVMTPALSGTKLRLSSPSVIEAGARYNADNGSKKYWFGINNAGTYAGIYDETGGEYVVRDDGSTMFSSRDIQEGGGKLLSKAPQSSAETLSGNSNKTYSLENNTRGLLVVMGANSPVRGLYIYNTSNGTVGISTVLSASGLTLTTGANSLSISNSTTTTAILWFLSPNTRLPL